ncbi:MAG: glycosyltransferase family 4 protein [Pirellulaceae bacterium]
MSGNPIRIMMINDHIHFGGGGDAVFRLEKSCYEDAGYEVFTFSQAPAKPEFATERDFMAIESPSRLVRKAGKFLYSRNVASRLRDALQSVQPHFISVHLVSKYPLSIYRHLGDYPAVQTVHGPSLFCTSSWGCLKNGDECELGIGFKCFKRGCCSASMTGLYTMLDKRLSGDVKKNVDYFACPSQHIQASADSLGFRPTEFIPLGIDDPFKKESASDHNGPPMVLSVGALIEEKGIHFLLEAFQTVVQRVPQTRLQIAGRGAWGELLKQKASDLGLDESVDFLGFVDHATIVDLYRKASVFVIPSIYKEQFGLVGPEALACGVPCVGSNFGGIPEWLHDGKWGFCVPPRDSGALADKIVTLLENRDLRCEFGQRGRQWAISQYSPDKYRDNRMRLVDQFTRTPAN